MTRAALKGMLARKLRTALTAIAVVLGVAMVSGAYVLTDTMLNAADGLSAAAYENVDAVVSTHRAFEPIEDGPAETRPLPGALVRTVRAVPEVGIAAGEISGDARLVGRDGKPIGSAGSPAFASGVDVRTPGATRLSPFRVTRGRFPRDAHEVAIDAQTAKKEHLTTGDTIGVAARGAVLPYRIVGVVGFGDVTSIGDATAAVFDLRAAQQLLGKRGQVDSILVAARDGASAAQVRRAIAPALPRGVDVRSAQADDRFDIGGLRDGLRIIRSFLVAFGGVALFVGGFVIFNTLSITVAQRARELAMLRTVGASRRQVLASVVLEAVVIGLIGSVVGIACGLGLAAGLSALFRSMGLDLPHTDTVLAARTIAVSLGVGVGVTTVAGLVPAIRATRVEPVVALREGTSPLGHHSRHLGPAAMATTALGVGGLAYGMFAGGLGASERLAAIGIGCLVLFVGVALLSARIARPLASALGRPARRIGGPAGTLARETAMRNPGRTAATAAALMIGLALVTFVAVLGQGLRSSSGSSLERQLDAHYVVTGRDGYTPVTPEAAAALRTAAGAGTVVAIREDQMRAFGHTTLVDGIDPATIGRVYRFHWSAGSLQALGRDGAIVTKRFADDNGLGLGERFAATAPSGRRIGLRVAGIDARPEFNPLSLADVSIPAARFDAAFQARKHRYVFVRTAGGATAATTRSLEQALAPYPDTKLQTTEQYRAGQDKNVRDFLSLLYVLLALSVLVSVLGIVNTLVLAVFERTRELGLLRAVGMTRRQVRRMIRHESVIVALIGATLGLAVGLFLAALVTAALAGEGLTFAVPVGTLVAFLVVAVLAGILAAILPARRAARLDVLAALQYE
jgi:putative ABC transport system permease protein